MFYLRAYQKKICSKCNNTSDDLDKNKVCPTCKEVSRQKKKQDAKERAANPIRKGVSKVKLDMINLLGGKCNHCGYSRYISALEFHHKDPKEKKFLVASLISRYNTTPTQSNYDLLVTEVNKCLLLCSNCHTAKHSGEW